MTRSTGHSGLILEGSPPSLFMASLIAAKSTTAGTPLWWLNRRMIYVKSWRITLAGLKGISTSFFELLDQSKIFPTSACFTLNSSQFRIADSSNILIEYGKSSLKSQESKNTYSFILQSRQPIKPIFLVSDAHLGKNARVGICLRPGCELSLDLRT